MMKKLSALALFIFASSAIAQVQLGKSVQIGFGSGEGSGTVASGTAGQIAQYPADGTTVQGATVSGDGSLASGGAFTLSTVNNTPGTCGDSTHIPQFTVNGKGLTTSCSQIALPSPFAGANGMVFNTSATTSRNAIFSDIVPLWGNGSCTGYLKSDGTCDSGSSTAITSLTGAVTATGPGSAAATITATGVAAGTYGGPAQSFTGTVNVAGQITSASNSPITPAGIGAAVAPVYAIAPVVDYHFQEGSGTTVFDFSGNGYNATLGSGARLPTWIPNGLAFPTGTGVDMPTESAINTAQTWCWVGNFNPLNQNTFAQSGYSSLMASNDGGTNGVTYTGLYIGSLVHGSYGQVNGVGGFNTFVNNVGITSPNSTYVGVTRVCIVRGKTSNSTVDHVYYNGHEVDSYYAQGKTGDTTNATFYTIGAEASGTWASGLYGSTMYRVTGWAAQLTPTQIQQADQVQQYDLTTRGVSVVSVPLYHQTPQFINMGDSITFCQGLTSTQCWNYPSNIQPLLTNQPTYTESNFGVTSITAFAIGASEPGRGTNFCQTSQGPGMLTLWEGTNDLGIFASLSTQTLVNNVAGAIQKYKQAGCRVFVATTISRCGNAPGTGCAAPGSFEAARAAFNQQLINQAKSFGADGIVDIAALPYLGATNAYNAGVGGGTCSGATTYFQVDCVHPTATAQPFISQVFANSLNYYTGTTFANPYVVTATATLPSSARVTDASGCTSACTLTLPDGTGPSGESYTIITGPTNVVSVQGQTLYGLAQTVNGSSSAVALPTNATVSLRIVPLAQATAGVKWVY